jgi:hypothetical protein
VNAASARKDEGPGRRVPGPSLCKCGHAAAGYGAVTTAQHGTSRAGTPGAAVPYAPLVKLRGIFNLVLCQIDVELPAVGVGPIDGAGRQKHLLCRGSLNSIAAGMPGGSISSIARVSALVILPWASWVVCIWDSLVVSGFLRLVGSCRFRRAAYLFS